jgi:altronate hydrolase
MAEPLVLHLSDTIAVLTERAKVGDDLLDLGVPLAAPVSSGHKVARVATAAGAPVIKLGQFIGQATVAIAAGDHVHTHNCVFANPEKDYAIGADLAAAQRAIPHTELLTFSGYARSDGRIGTRNYIALVATVNRSATVIRRAASEIVASRLLEDYASVDGVVALAHGTGCGMANSGRGFDILDRVLWGHAIHPNVGATVSVGLGYEVMQIAGMQPHFGTAGTDRFQALTIQDTGGTRATIDVIKTHVALLHGA